MATPIFLFILMLFSALVTAKFGETYIGIASEGVEACINNSNFTHETITQRVRCAEAFRCVMDNTPNYYQSILSSGSAIMGFIPTVLLILGNTDADILQIHARYPILALFLSITNINKRPSKERTYTAHQCASHSPRLGPYTIIRRTKSSTPSPESPWTKHTTLWALHVLAGVGASIVIWQAVDTGKKGVITWACWTDFYPVLWVAMGVVHHFLSVVCMRLNLYTTQSAPHPPTSPISHSPKPQSALWIWDLTHERLEFQIRNLRWARWSTAATGLLNNVNYLYGTAVFSSLTLITGAVAIQKLVAFGVVVVGARVVTVWVVGDMLGKGGEE